jgi:hypothetical protein
MCAACSAYDEDYYSKSHCVSPKRLAQFNGAPKTTGTLSADVEVGREMGCGYLNLSKTLLFTQLMNLNTLSALTRSKAVSFNPLHL